MSNRNDSERKKPSKAETRIAADRLKEINEELTHRPPTPEQAEEIKQLIATLEAADSFNLKMPAILRGFLDGL